MANELMTNESFDELCKNIDQIIDNAKEKDIAYQNIAKFGSLIAKSIIELQRMSKYRIHVANAIEPTLTSDLVISFDVITNQFRYVDSNVEEIVMRLTK